MLTKMFKNYQRPGFTLLEILIVIGLMATLSVLFVFSNKPSKSQRFTNTTENLANDLRYIRNLTMSRAVYNGVYPGGYGITIYNGNGTSIFGRYILYAGTPSNVIKSVTFGDVSFRVGDFNNSNTVNSNTWQGDIKFVDENNINSTLYISPSNQYQLFLQYPDSVTDGTLANGQPSIKNGFQRAVLLIGEKSNDNFVWANVGHNINFVESKCNNCTVEPGEYCDDCNTDDSDGCWSDCKAHGGGGSRDDLLIP